jgi:rubrerythrin
MDKKEKSLQKAFAEESQASRKYKAFALCVD